MFSRLLVPVLMVAVVAGCADETPTSPLATPTSSAGHSAVTTPAAPYVDVAVGFGRSCVLRADGGVICWGAWGTFQPEGSFTSLEVGSSHACGLREDGTVACWGDNSNGQLNGIPVGTFEAVRVGGSQACALAANGSVSCWGPNFSGLGAPPPGPFTTLSVGLRDACALTPSQALVCWGRSLFGVRNEPPGTFTAVDVGLDGACAVRTDGALVCWGRSFGAPTVTPGMQFTDVNVGTHVACALTTTGQLACWGWAGHSAPAGTYARVSSGDKHSCALTTAAQLVCFGQALWGETLPPMSNLPPLANAGPNQLLECTSPGGAQVTLDGSASSDDGTIVEHRWLTGGTTLAIGRSTTVGLPIGVHGVDLQVTDDGGLTDTDATTITIADTQAPEIIFPMIETVVWPPNGTMRLVATGIRATDTCAESPTVEVMVSHGADAEVRETQDGSYDVWVRATRGGAEGDRVYTVTVSATDPSGNKGTVTRTVTVPHDRRASGG